MAINRYEIIINRGNLDNVFIAEIPELTGSIIQGESCNKALKEVSTIANEWITIDKENGWDITEPKGRLIYA